MTVRTVFTTLAIAALLAFSLAPAGTHAQTEVKVIGAGTIVTGTASLTTTPAAISATSTSVRELLLQCDSANLVDCYIGNGTSQVVHIAPGQSLTIAVANLNLLFAKTGSSTATINYIGRL